MKTKQANILFIPTSINRNSAEVQGTLSHLTYQKLICASGLARSARTIEELQLLGQHVAAIARQAWAAKDLNAVEHASQVMLALPIADQLESSAQYYRALCTWWRGDRENARQSLARIVEESTHLRSRALHAIGLTYHEGGEIDVALPFYLEAGNRAAKGDLLAIVESQRIAAVVHSIHGDHKRALADLERLFPSVRAICTASPVLYYEFLNSLAVELGEVGRIAEAEAALSIALASPFAAAYPEWSATRDEIAAKRKTASPSVVAIHRVLEDDRSHETDRNREAHRATEVERTHEAHRAIEARRATDVALATQTQSRRKPNPFSALAFSSQASNKDFFQRSIIKFPAKTTNALNNAASILDRVLICVGPRAPPSLS